MMRRPDLAIWLDERRVAVMKDAGDGASVSYTEEALDVFGVGRPVLSVTLPTRVETYPGVATQAFLDGLLPEGWARDRLADIARRPRSDTFGLLAAFGRDCAGAVSILPDSEGPDNRDAGVEWLTDEGLANAVRDLGAAPFGDDPTRGIRVSLGGVQEKLAVVVDGTAIGLPVGLASSTHILKPVPLDSEGRERWPGMAQLELFCLELAANVSEAISSSRARGFGSPPARLIGIGSRLAVLVTRYDRRREGAGWRRIHQEDACQALALGPDRKYQTRIGAPPNLAAVAKVLDDWGTDPIIDKRALLQMVFFNVIIGNADLHAKNISLLGHPYVRIAPAYDLVSTASYAGLDQELGLFIGAAMDIGDVEVKDLLAEAHAWGLGERAARAALSELAEAVRNRIDATAGDPELSHPIVSATAERAISQSSKFLDQLEKMTRA